MKVRNIIHKAAVLGSSAVMLGATAMSSLAYELADYPAQFIVDGATDGKIVVGEKAATPDVLGAIDIAASLQAGSVTQEAVDIPGVSGETTLTGDAFRLETSSDLLEIREDVGNVYDTLTDSELDALGGGQITTDEGSTDYNQYLRFEDSTNTLTLQAMAVNYDENEDDELGDFLVIGDNNPFFEWEIEFTEGLESAITSGELEDLEDEVFNIFGTDFTFVNSDISTTDDDITLEFMAGDISDTLREGETKTYTIDGVDYEVTAVFISDPSSSGSPEAKFAVNGELTDGLADGQTDTLNNGLQIGVRDLLVNSREGVVEFFLGANKIELTDNNYLSATVDSNGELAGSVEIANENIEDASVAIVGQELSSGTKFEITSIKYRLKADAKIGSTIYVPPGHGVREFLDEPEGLLSPSFDIRYEGLKDVQAFELSFESRSDHSYEFTATNIRGKTYEDVPFVTNQDGTFKWGDDDDEFWFIESAVTNTTRNASAYTVVDDDYFVLSENVIGSADEKDDSAIMRYEDIDTSDRIITFTDMSSGETREVTYTTDTSDVDILGNATNFVVEGNTYSVWVGNATGWPLAVDLNGDGDVNGDEVGFTAKGGAIVDFGNGTQTAGTAAIAGSNPNSVNISITGDQFDDSAAVYAEAFWFTIDDATGNEVTLSVSQSNHLAVNAGNNDWDRFTLTDDDSNDDYEYGMLDYGALVEYYNPSGSSEAESLMISMPEAQVGAQVFVVAGVVESSTSGSGSVTREVVNPISVGLAVLDKDASGMLGNENLIIVGGPCANTVASAFLGSPSNCAEGFTPGKAMISAKDYGSNVAILVAGYEATETLGASYVLADYATYLADVEGSEVEVVASDLSDLRVAAPSMEEAAAEE